VKVKAFHFLHFNDEGTLVQYSWSPYTSLLSFNVTIERNLK